MKLFKVTYATGLIASIRETTETVRLNEDRFVYEYNGYLIYAVVKAKTEDEARVLAEEIMLVFYKRVHP